MLKGLCAAFYRRRWTEDSRLCAQKPACLDDPEVCPLAELCDQVGVNTIDGTVTDPADLN